MVSSVLQGAVVDAGVLLAAGDDVVAAGTDGHVAVGFGLEQQHKGAVHVVLAGYGVHHLADGVEQVGVGLLGGDKAFGLHDDGLVGERAALGCSELAGHDDLVILGPQAACRQQRCGNSYEKAFLVHLFNVLNYTFF